MATAERVIAIAQKELGVKESPVDSNNVPYNTWYYGREVSGPGYPWCMVFVQWVFAQAGVKLPARTASCSALMTAAMSSGRWVTVGFQPGDVVIYDFGGDGVPDHCGIVDLVHAKSVLAIEGNTSESGSQSNGGMVCQKERPLKRILGAVRPQFDRADLDNTPSPAHKEGVEWAVEAGILLGNAEGDLMLHQGMTREQICTILKRYDERKEELRARWGR